MSANSGSDDSSTEHNPTAREYIVRHLAKFGRSTVHEMATSIDYSHGHTRRVAVDLLAEGVIEGEQTDSILSCEINGMWIILNSNRGKIIGQLQQCASHLAAQARGMNLDDIHDLVQNNANQIGTLGEKWEFWIDPATLSASSQGESGAQADDD